MNVREQIKKVAELLEEKVMYFDWKSYDFAEDIPHLTLDGKRENIESVVINKDGTFMEVMTEDGEIGLGFYEDEENTFESIDKELEECGMDEFLRDIYYNHLALGRLETMIWISLLGTELHIKPNQIAKALGETIKVQYCRTLKYEF